LQTRALRATIRDMGGPRLPVDDGDAELVRRASGGETAAFARLIRLHHEALTRVAVVITLDAASAAQAVRDAWPRVIADLGRSDAGTSFIHRAAGPVSDEALHQAGRRRAVDPANPTASLAGLAGLAPRDRAVVSLHVLAGHAVQDLARRARRPAAEIDTRLTALLGAVGGPDALRTWATVPVQPVDADATAAWAKAEAAFARNARWSVVVATAAGLLVAGLPYLARLLQGR
jgi:DNA-directed RNA polymerase specialized sigma24 family protein